MATDPQMLNLQNQADQLQSKLGASSTAYGGDQPARPADVESQVRLSSVQDQITKLRDKQLKDQWGLNDAPQDNQNSPGIIGGALDGLARPLYAVVGGAESILGKGVTPGLSANIVENMNKGKRTFKDLLEKEGAPYIVAAPLGFAMDVALDPVNWATAGSTALVPRVTMGLVRGTARGGVTAGLEAAAAGAQSSRAGIAGARMVSRVVRNLPYSAETAIGSKLVKATDTAANAATRYDELTGRDFLGKTLSRVGLGVTNPITDMPLSDYRITLGDLAKHAITALPKGVGETIWKNMEYSNTNWLRIVRLKDALLKASGVKSDAEKVVQGSSIEAAGADMEAKIRAAEPTTPIDWHGGGEAIGKEMPETEIDKKFSEALHAIGREDAEAPLRQGVQDSLDIAHNPALGTTADGVENALRLASEAAGRPIMTLDELKKMVSQESLGDTGIEMYDNMMKDIRELRLSTNANINKIAPAVKSTLDFYDKWMAIFRAAKVVGSPSSIVNASVGNPTFYGMMGGDMTDGKWWKMLMSAAGYQLGTKKSAAFWQKLMDIPQIRSYIEENPTAIRTGFGIPGTERQKAMTAEQLVRIAKDHGMLPQGAKITDEGVMEKVATVMDTMKQAIAEGMAAPEAEGFLKQMKNNARGGLQEARATIAKKGAETSRYDLPTGMFSQEYMESPAARKMMEKVAENAKGGNWIWKAMDIWLNKAPSFYEGIDQSYKLGTFAHLTMNGITERELNIMRRTVEMNPEDIMDKWNDAGVWRFRLAPDKAMQVVMESYLNYAAMPGFVRMMRNFPLMGAPFVSFAYGTSLKTMNTLATNPSFFNKMQFAVNDFGGTKSPLEKEALNGPYYSYLNKQTMFKLPFFQQNPVYLNLGYALPYYSLNAFSPSGRAYKELLPDTVTSIIDKSQLMGNPLGQVIFDYAILPHILSSSADPQGSFGQTLYPRNATGLQKTGYAARQLAESVMPGFASIPGGLAQGLTAPGATEYVPSYRWRQIAYATQGKDQYGISRKEPAASRTLRGILTALGIPVQSPVDLTNVANQGKKK